MDYCPQIGILSHVRILCAAHNYSPQFCKGDVKVVYWQGRKKMLLVLPAQNAPDYHYFFIFFCLAQFKLNGEWGPRAGEAGRLGNADLNLQSCGYAQAACRIATSIAFPPCFCLIFPLERDSHCWVFSFCTRNSMFAFYVVTSCRFKVRLQAVLLLCLLSVMWPGGGVYLFTMLWNGGGALGCVPTQWRAVASTRWLLWWPSWPGPCWPPAGEGGPSCFKTMVW